MTNATKNSSRLRATSSKWSPRFPPVVGRLAVNLSHAQHLSKLGIVVDHIALNALKERSVRLGYTPSALTDAVADLTVMLTLMAQRLGGEVRYTSAHNCSNFRD